MERAVVLLSGGIDSSVTTAIARTVGFEIYALSFDYGQRHRRELESAELVAEALGVKRHLIIKFDMREIGGSALTSDIEVPKDRKALSVMRNKSKGVLRITHHASRITAVPITYVPARNTIFLSFALAWAETIGARDIFIGANAIDYSGYPDCRPKFIKAFQSMANLATKASVEGTARFKIHTPLINLTKGEIIKKGAELGVNFLLTWSCYDPQKDRNALFVKRNGLKKNTHHASRITRHGYVPCGSCDSCLLRAKGFREARIEDPLIVKVKGR